MRRSVILFVLFLAAAGAFAVDFGFGVSGGFVLNETSTSLASPAVSSETRYTHVPFGASIYADLGVVVVSAGYTQFTFNHELSTQTVSGTLTTLVDADTGTGGYISVALLAKLPIALGSVTLSPVAGIGMDINVLLLGTAGNDLRAGMTDQQLSEQNHVWITAGAALDVALSDRAYLRSEVLFSYKLLSGGELSAYLAAQQAGFSVLLYTIKPEVDLLIGFKL